MAEFALAVNIIEAVKATCQVATFVYETIKSVRHEDVEQQQIASDFGRELLFLASFRRYLEKTQGVIAYDKTLDDVSHWQDPRFMHLYLSTYLHAPAPCSYGFQKSSRSSSICGKIS